VLGDHPVACTVGGTVLAAVVVVVLDLAGVLPWPASAGRPAAAGRPALAGRPAAGGVTASGGSTASGGASAAGEFLTAWRAHLMASWSVDEVVARTPTSGATVRFDVHEAQAPPMSVSVGNGTVSARRGATEVACGPGAPGQPYACRSAPAPLTWQQSVDQQMAALAAELQGPRPFFSVRRAGGGCWAFTLVQPAQAVPVVLGRGATFCLDTATGALRSSEVQRVGAVDRVTVVSSHAPATAGDLALPAGAGA
jgi:hypothetical protein